MGRVGKVSGWLPLAVSRPHSSAHMAWGASGQRVPGASLKEECKETPSVSAQLQLEQDCQLVNGSDLAYGGKITRLS